MEAFDTASRTAPIAILRKLGVPNRRALFIERLHTDAKVKMKVGATDVPFEAAIGAMQVTIWRQFCSFSTCKLPSKLWSMRWPVSKPKLRYKLDFKLTGRAYNTKGSKFDFWSCLYADDSALLFANAPI